MSKNSNKKTGKDKGKGGAGGTIALNKRARHDYNLEEKFEAGLSLQGWELKAIRAGRANIIEGYAMVRNGEIFLHGMQITPLISASTHVVAEERRTRKLLMHRAEIDNLIGRDPARRLYRRADCAVLEGQQGQGRDRPGQGQAGTRQAPGQQGADWQREKQRVMRRHNKDA